MAAEQDKRKNDYNHANKNTNNVNNIKPNNYSKNTNNTNNVKPNKHTSNENEPPLKQCFNFFRASNNEPVIIILDSDDENDRSGNNKQLDNNKGDKQSSKKEEVAGDEKMIGQEESAVEGEGEEEEEEEEEEEAKEEEENEEELVELSEGEEIGEDDRKSGEIEEDEVGEEDGSEEDEESEDESIASEEVGTGYDGSDGSVEIDSKRDEYGDIQRSEDSEENSEEDSEEHSKEASKEDSEEDRVEDGEEDCEEDCEEDNEEDSEEDSEGSRGGDDLFKPQIITTSSSFPSTPSPLPISSLFSRSTTSSFKSTPPASSLSPRRYPGIPTIPSSSSSRYPTKSINASPSYYPTTSGILTFPHYSATVTTPTSTRHSTTSTTSTCPSSPSSRPNPATTTTTITTATTASPSQSRHPTTPTTSTSTSYVPFTRYSTAPASITTVSSSGKLTFNSSIPTHSPAGKHEDNSITPKNYPSPAMASKNRLSSPSASPGKAAIKVLDRDETANTNQTEGHQYDSVVEISMTLPEGHEVKTVTKISYTSSPSSSSSQSQPVRQIPSPSSFQSQSKRKRKQVQPLSPEPIQPQAYKQNEAATQPMQPQSQQKRQKQQTAPPPQLPPNGTVNNARGPKKTAFFRPTVIGNRTACLFCAKSEGESTYEGEMVYSEKSDVNLHSECLYHASRGEGESIPRMLRRVAGQSKRLINCKHCKEKVGSVGCVVAKCQKSYHYKCAIVAGGKWDPASRSFYCKEHYTARNEELLLIYKSITKWPRRTIVKFLLDNTWDEIKSTHRDYIARYATIEGSRAGNADDMWTIAWENQQFTPKIEIREIGPGHWAWCSDLAADQKSTRNRQYEAVANEDINEDDFIGEYIGRVRYDNPSTLRNPYVASVFVPHNPSFRKKMGPLFTGLCIDSSMEGNETRFINSVTRQSPPHIKQNATMDTVWCRGQLRVIVRAIRAIQKGWPIVLDYDEHIRDDGSKSYFDSDSETETCNSTNTQPPPTHFRINNVLLPISTVVVPWITAPPHPPTPTPPTTTNNTNNQSKKR